MPVRWLTSPGGTFRMGDLSGEGDEDERPVHAVTVPAFRMGKYEVTFAQWDACVADGGCGGYRPDDEGWGKGNRPVINVSWDDAQLFIDWLNDKTDGKFRLPTEAEWEYAARAGSTTKYHFGDSESQLCRYANHADDSTDYSNRQTSPVLMGSVSVPLWWGATYPTVTGFTTCTVTCGSGCRIAGMIVYVGAPTDSSAWTQGDCSRRVYRGGSWYNILGGATSAYRNEGPRTDHYSHLGFRLAQDK